MDYDGRVVFKIDGDDSGLQKAIGNTTNALSGLKSVLVKLGLGALLTKSFSSAVKSTNEFESSLAKASTLFGSVAVDTDNLSKKILALSSATGQASASIGNSLYNALSAGVEVTEDMGTAMDFLESATKLSIAGFTDVDTAVTATAKVMNAYGKEMYSAEKIGEILMQTQNLGITTVDQLGSALATVTPIAASFGVSFEQIGASLALMTKQGTDTATATTQLRGMISELGQDGTTASKNLQKAFARTGKEYKNFAEYMKDPNNNLQGAIKLLEEEAHLAGLSLSDMFGNIRAGVGALQLAKDETGLYSTFLQNLAGDTNLVEEAYNKMMDTRTNKLKKMREQLKNISINIVNSPAVQNLLDGLTNTAQKFLDKLEEWLPAINSALSQFSFDAKVVFASLKNQFEESFLYKGIKTVIEITKNQLKTFLEQFTNGDLFGAVLTFAEGAMILKVGFTLLKTGAKSLPALVGTFAGAFGKLGFAALTFDAIELAIGLKWAKQTGNWDTFSQEFLIALIPAAFATAFLGVVGGALVFGISFKILRNIAENRKGTTTKAREAAAEDPTQSANPLIDELQITKEMKTALKEEIQDVKELSNELDTITDALYSSSQKYPTIVERLEKVASTEIGRNVINGLTDDYEAPISEWSDELCLTVIMALRNSFDINSPSKVARDEVGYWIGLGITEGIWSEDTAQAIDESVDKIIDRITQDVGKKGKITPAEALRLYPRLMEYAQSRKDALASASASTSQIAGARTTGGGGINSIDGWGLDENGVWREENLKNIAKTLNTDMHKGWESFITDLTDVKARADTFKEAFQSAFDMIGQGFEDFGQSIAKGETDWAVFARAGLNAISTLLEAIGKELSVIAIEALVAENYPKAILAGAGSATAFVAAGLVKGWANSFERGGIVGGSGITGDKHVIYANAGELILNRAQQGAIASQLGRQSGPNITIAFNGQVFGDQATISSYVYDGIRNAQREGGLPSWS